MKKVISFATSFLLGFAFFVAGGAVASETVITNEEPVSTTETVEVLDPGTETVVENVQGIPLELPYCFNIGKASEIDSDCFCVEGDVTSMDEVDCLIASGIVPSEEYEAYRQLVLGE